MSIAAAIALLIVAALGLATRFYMSRSAEDRLRPGEDIALAELRGPLPQNGFLACPAGYCALEAGMVSPDMPVDVDRLVRLWPEVVQAESGIVTIEARSDRRRFVLIQHSAALRFPDVVTVEFVALGPRRSSVAMYSRARYGKLDFGVNRRRVETWIARLDNLATAAAARDQ